MPTLDEVRRRFGKDPSAEPAEEVKLPKEKPAEILIMKAQPRIDPLGAHSFPVEWPGVEGCTEVLPAYTLPSPKCSLDPEMAKSAGVAPFGLPRVEVRSVAPIFCEFAEHQRAGHLHPPHFEDHRFVSSIEIADEMFRDCSSGTILDEVFRILGKQLGVAINKLLFSRFREYDTYDASGSVQDAINFLQANIFRKGSGVIVAGVEAAHVIWEHTKDNPMHDTLISAEPKLCGQRFLACDEAPPNSFYHIPSRKFAFTIDLSATPDLANDRNIYKRTMSLGLITPILLHAYPAEGIPRIMIKNEPVEPFPPPGEPPMIY